MDFLILRDGPVMKSRETVGKKLASTLNKVGLTLLLSLHTETILDERRNKCCIIESTTEKSLDYWHPRNFVASTTICISKSKHKTENYQGNERQKKSTCRLPNKNSSHGCPTDTSADESMLP